jgi:hypothetical protein
MSNLSEAAENAKKRYPLGCRIRGTVLDHMPFGIFVDIGDPEALGVVLIVEFVDDGRMTPEMFPAIGESVESVVVGWSNSTWKDWPCEVGLSMKPSKLSPKASN